MDKSLIIINGTMGVGKSAVCKKLNKRIPRSVWLDGDWCWMMNPFIVNQENKNMVIDNITYLLRNFLDNSSFDYVILSWVIHDEEIFEMLLERLSEQRFYLSKITLICSEAVLKERILKDIKQGFREQRGLETSVSRLHLYKAMKTEKVDTTDLSIPETANRIIDIIEQQKNNVMAKL